MIFLYISSQINISKSDAYWFDILKSFYKLPYYDIRIGPDSQIIQEKQDISNGLGIASDIHWVYTQR